MKLQLVRADGRRKSLTGGGQLLPLGHPLPLGHNQEEAQEAQVRTVNSLGWFFYELITEGVSFMLF
jgi:hypothetical protein